MIIKTNNLTGVDLNWAVAKCEGIENGTGMWAAYKWIGIPYSTDWAQGGPIIEREGIGVYQYRGAWSAHCPLPNGGLHACMENQPTPLIAAMRCYVASKLGDEVEIPEALCNQ